MVPTSHRVGHASRGQPAGRTFGFAAWSGAALLALLAFLPSANAAFQLEVLDGTVLHRSVQPASQSAVFEFAFRFQLDDDERLDFVVVPERENPVYDNGDPAMGGWWTEARVINEEETDEAAPDFEATNGSDAIELGRLDDNEPLRLEVRVHAPATALSEPGVWTLAYRLQEHEGWAVFGDDEVTVKDFDAVIAVMEPASTDAADPSAGIPPKAWNAPQVALVVGSAFLALGLITAFGGKP